MNVPICTSRMKTTKVDWKVTQLERLLTPFAIFEDELDEIESEAETAQIQAIEELLKILFPNFDPWTLENGLSARQLGCLTGHLRSIFGSFELIEKEVEEPFVRIEKNAELIIEKGSRILTAEESLAVQEEIDWAQQVKQASGMLNAGMSQVFGLRPDVEAGIRSCVSAAACQGGEEAKAFFHGLFETICAEILDSKGNFVSKDPRTATVRSFVAVCGHYLRDCFSTATEFHRFLSKISPEIFTPDETSLEWGTDRKSINYVLGSLGFRFCGPGRKNRKGNSNQK